MDGVSVRKKFGDDWHNGIAEYRGDEEPRPFIYLIRYEDGDEETMTAEDVKRYRVVTQQLSL